MNTPETSEILYALEPDLSVAEFRDVLIRSTLSERRPVDQPETLRRMLKHAQLILTARTPSIDNQPGKLVGVSRAISDFAYCTYLSDLAVDAEFQRQGIGKRLIQETHKAAGLETRLILLAAPAAVTYYRHIGMELHPSCWQIPPKVQAK